MVILVVGAGSIGRRHAANLETLGAAVELIPWRGFDRAAVERRGDVAGMVIATATDVRLPLAEIAGAKGWPVYLEKPLALHPAEVAAVYEALAPVAGRSVLGFMMRYHPALRALHEADWSDAYGFHFEIGHDVRQWRANWRFADSYAARAEGGGVLLDLCHEIDMAACLFPGLEVLGCDSLGHAGFPGVDFATRVTLGRADGPLGTVAMDYLAPTSLRRGAVRGLRVAAEVDFLGHSVEIGGVTRRFAFERNAMFLDAMRDFLALVAGRELADPLVPRLDRMRGVADLVAAAWEARVFRGAVRMDMG